MNFEQNEMTLTSWLAAIVTQSDRYKVEMTKAAASAEALIHSTPVSKVLIPPYKVKTS